MSDVSHRFDSGKFIGVDGYLGELRTDEAGRLVFLGGHGKSPHARESRWSARPFWARRVSPAGVRPA
jgi:hypothetical protein